MGDDMLRETISQMIYEALAEEVLGRVEEKLIARQKKALVVYTGSTMGFEDALLNLTRLREAGFSFHVFLSKSASEVLNAERIQKALLPTQFEVGSTALPPERTAAQYDTILAPAVTIHSAAKLAACMADTPAVRMLFDAMARGKNVILSINGCCPENEERLEKGFHMSEGLKARLREHLKAISSYGACLCTADQLYETAMHAIAPQFGAAQRAPASLGQGAPERVLARGKVLGRSAIMAQRPNCVLIVPKGTLITQMARDAAAERGVILEPQE